MADEEELKRQRQSKAFGAAFLAHQVSQLEQSVDSLAFSRDSRLYTRGGRGGRGGRGAGRGGAAAIATGQGHNRQVRVVDPSVLVHALPVLKRWIREDKYKLIVPLSALSTLDMLKKAPEPLHGLARDATRFLEGQLSIANQIQAAFSPEDAELRIRLRAQSSAEELPWSEVQKLFQVPDDWTVELPEDVEVPRDEEDEEPAPLPLPTVDDIPRHLRGALQAALFFAVRKAEKPASASADDASASTVLFKSMIPTPPPLAGELSKLVGRASPAVNAAPGRPAATGPPPPDYLAISSGDALAYYLDTFFPSVASKAYHAIPATQVVAATAWLKQQAAHRHGASTPDGARRGDPSSGRRGGRPSGDRAAGSGPSPSRGRGQGTKRSNALEGAGASAPGSRSLFSPT